MGFIERIFNRQEISQQRIDPEIPQHDSIDDNQPVTYHGDSLTLNLDKLPVGGNGYPIRWRGKPARVILDENGNLNFYLEKN